ncbi:rhodanese-related sulfurtransferase/TusA-related sulfurtransferase [Salibacterium salarium]|uniref:sulfurtransferase TusA family protein n=1 Tax=Salibacterium salarium TaxID=284579 RepID=UPI002789667D|nr:sulfurtransferase TusA family protein [Salibacterium salarium]MDQ0297604.1 rhodanese-related sulfurtransferase/TusA-related sulfurtransferase [Salibacterium salarium]
MSMKVNETVDAKGLACPMPIVKTKKAIESIHAGEVLEVQATDRGSLADLQGWAKTTGHEYVGSKEKSDVLYHYVRKADPEETKAVEPFPNEENNEQLKAVQNQDDVTILDVREPAEFAFSHIPGAVSVPLGELEEKMNELDASKNIHVVCRTGNRSSMAAQMLKDKGFDKVVNVNPGMSEWDGPTESIE